MCAACLENVTLFALKTVFTPPIESLVEVGVFRRWRGIMFPSFYRFSPWKSKFSHRCLSFVTYMNYCFYLGLVMDISKILLTGIGDSKQLINNSWKFVRHFYIRNIFVIIVVRDGEVYIANKIKLPMLRFHLLRLFIMNIALIKHTRL
jgi:hypothetical protein